MSTKSEVIYDKEFPEFNNCRKENNNRGCFVTKCFKCHEKDFSLIDLEF